MSVKATCWIIVEEPLNERRLLEGIEGGLFKSRLAAQIERDEAMDPARPYAVLEIEIAARSGRGRE